MIKKTKFHTISETLDVREITTAKTLSIIFVQKRLEKDLIFNSPTAQHRYFSARVASVVTCTALHMHDSSNVDLREVYFFT